MIDQAGRGDFAHFNSGITDRGEGWFYQVADGVVVESDDGDVFRYPDIILF